MKKLIVVVFAVAVLVGCAKKPSAPSIAEWNKYTDPYYGMSFDYPKGWPFNSEGGNFYVYSSQDVVNRFIDLTTKGIDGARLVVSILKMDTLKTLDEYITNTKNDLTNSGYEVKTSEPKSLDNLTGVLLNYIGTIDRDNTIESLLVTAMQDSSIYSVKFEAFNKLFTAYRMVFDTALATLKLPKSKSVDKVTDPSIPSTEFEVFENNFLKISYPSNFETSMPQPKAPIEFAIDIKGYRQDSDLHIDVRPAQGLTPEKVVEQNLKFYKETVQGTAVVDGVNTTFLNYSPVKGIQSRVYFIVKNDRITRVIINYFASMKNVYLPAFEKTVASLVIK